MIQRYIGFTLLLLFPYTVFATTPPQHVVLITLDGVLLNVMQNEVKEPTLLPFTIAQAKKHGTIIGTDPLNRMVVSNTSSKSLPGYRAILSGQFQSQCDNNDCGQIDSPTIFDEITNAAVFASWDRIGRATTQHPEIPIEGSIAFRKESLSLVSEETQKKIKAVLQKSKKDRPIWKDARKDAYTWEAAKLYLKERVPQLTYLSFLDTDEWAHHRNYENTLQALNDFDTRFQELQTLLSEKGLLDHTSFVITTDHGRGRYMFWTTHGKFYKNSKKIFAIIIPSRSIREQYVTQATKQVLAYDQLQIRPTLETLLHPDQAEAAVGAKKHRSSLITLKTATAIKRKK